MNEIQGAGSGKYASNWAEQAVAKSGGDTGAQYSAHSFVGEDSGMTYSTAAAGALAQVSTEGLQNAADYYYGTDTDIPPSVVGISRDSDVYKSLQAAGLTNEDGSIKGIAFVDERSRRRNGGKAGLDGEGKQLTVNEITVNMSDAERAQILRNKTITPVAVSDEHSEHFDYADLKAKIKSKVEKTLLKKFQELGFLKKYSAPTLGDITFSFTAGGVKKSIHAQENFYGGDKADFTKAVVHLQELLDNSVLIETHTDKGAGTERENIRLKQVYVLLSAMQDGESIIPVQFEIKQYVDDNNRLYLAVALTKIETGVKGYTASDNQIRTSLLPVSTISISELVAKINPADRNFLKYIPDEFLNGEQLDAKRRALDEDARKYGTAAQPARNTRSHEARPLTENEKNRLGWVCQRLNVDVDFDYQGVGDGVYLPAENGRRARISLSAAPLEPYKFVFKHELAHHLQTAKGYEQTRKALLGSPVFTDWLTDKYGGSIVQARAAVIERYSQQGVTLNLTEATDELVADFFADCAFDGLDGEIDNQFLDRLATDEPNLFKRLWNAVKDLVERLRGMFYFKDMSEVERRFEMLARQVQAGQTENTAKNGGARYSITEPFTDNNGNRYNNAVLLDTAFFDGLSPRNWGNKLKEFVYNRSANQPFIMPIVDENGKVQQLQFAKKSDRVSKNNSNSHLVLNELVETRDNISKLSTIHIDEIIEVSEERNPYYSSDNTHGWMDKNGWLHRNAYVINSKNGAIYNVTVDIAKTDDGRTLLYATKGKIKKVGQTEVNSLKLKGSGSHSNFNNSVPQNAAAVNNHSMQGNEKYSIPSDESAAEDRQTAAQQTAGDIVDAYRHGEMDAADYYYGTDTDIPPSVVGISRNSDVYKSLQAAGLTNEDGTIKGIAFVDERSRRRNGGKAGLDGEAESDYNENTIERDRSDNYGAGDTLGNGSERYRGEVQDTAEPSGGI